ncbi:MAG: hypothetical protein LC624_01565 [Halobacteriales archaeon]|nr:hypothetical protein [Halobacteriales archaeon]
MVPMRLVLALTLLLFVATAASASAHYLIQEETPVGEVCLASEEIILDGLRNQDPAQVAQGAATLDCEEEE